jgi:hypothetical protein
MPRTLQFRRLPADTLANTTGAIGELIVNSNNYTLTVHDGALPGGYALLNSATDNNIDQTARNTANTASNNITILQNVNVTQNTNIATATNLAQSAFDTANTADSNIVILQGVNTTQNTNIATATNLAQSAFDTANNANTRTVINGLGNSKLDFNTYGANTAYLTTTNDDSTALFMGAVTADLYAHTNISIRANTGGTSQNWTFDETGALTFPDSSVQTGGSISRIELKALVANSATYAAFQSAIAAL